MAIVKIYIQICYTTILVLDFVIIMAINMLFHVVITNILMSERLNTAHV